jgi:hypothetical protein
MELLMTVEVAERKIGVRLTSALAARYEVVLV